MRHVGIRHFSLNGRGMRSNVVEVDEESREAATKSGHPGRGQPGITEQSIRHIEVRRAWGATGFAILPPTTPSVASTKWRQADRFPQWALARTRHTRLAENCSFSSEDSS